MNTQKQKPTAKLSREERMASASIGSLVVSMAVPSILAQLINILYSIIDRIYIGHMEGVGAAALTGVGVTFCITVFISAFSAFISNGAAPLAAIWLGKQDREHAEKILGNSVTFLIICTAALMAFFYAFQRPLLYMFGASDVTIEYAVSYISIYLIGTIFVELALGLNAFIICQGQSRTAMYSVLIGAVANIALDPIFIFVFGLGVKGAAIATVISQALSAFWVVGFLSSRKSSLRIKASCMKPDKGVAFSIFSLGISPFIMRATESFISIVLNHGLQAYGGDLYVGSLTIMQSVMQIFSAPISGFTQGISPVISYNYGAGNFARVKEVYRWMIGACFVFMLLATASTMLFPEWYASFFTEDAELIALVGKTLPVFMFGMSIFGLQNGIQPTFLALGQAKISLFIAVFRKIILLIPLAIILPRFFGVMGVYYSEPVSDILSATTASVLFICNIKKMLSKEALAKIV
ncbi:MAG: MATE family efflux transporter [Bacillus sp. (in: Bacteria)]|nr:MATE family efflux transporter [Bacillus sp. (in: firmicutes)]MCM1426579.1 MATE family efflux transporter [Eubacterium sp.]